MAKWLIRKAPMICPSTTGLGTLVTATWAKQPKASPSRNVLNERNGKSSHHNHWGVQRLGLELAIQLCRCGSGGRWRFAAIAG